MHVLSSTGLLCKVENEFNLVIHSSSKNGDRKQVNLVELNEAHLVYDWLSFKCVKPLNHTS